MSYALLIGTVRKANNKIAVRSLKSDLRRMFSTIQINTLFNVKLRYYLEWNASQGGASIIEGKLLSCYYEQEENFIWNDKLVKKER